MNAWLILALTAEEMWNYQQYVPAAFSGSLCVCDSLLIKTLGHWKLCSSKIDLYYYVEKLWTSLKLQ